MSYAAITDPSNPFATSGLSREVRAILDYIMAARAATGWDIVVTSTTDHPKFSASGNVSRHRQPGNDGEGLAVDLRMRTRGTAPDLHDRAFNIFIPVEARCHELIYAYPPIGRRADGSTGPYNIRGGKRVAPYAVSDHRDHCFDSQTEVLTPFGWQRGIEVSKGQVVLGADLDGRLRWQPVLATVRRPANELVRLRATSIDLAVTEDHDLYVRGQWQKRYHKEAASTVYGKQRRVPAAGLDMSDELIDVPDAVVALAAWMLTDGHIERVGGWSIVQADRGDGRMERLEEVLTAAGVRYNRRIKYKAGTTGPGVTEVGYTRRFDAYQYTLLRGPRSSFPKPPWVAELLRLIDHDKNLRPEAWLLNGRQLRIFLDSWIDGDGAVVTERGRQTSSMRRDHMDFVQAAAARTGHRSHLYRYDRGEKAPLWRMSVGALSEVAVDRRNWSREAYDGDVWCVTVPDGGLLVRRDGRTALAGNCHVSVNLGVLLRYPQQPATEVRPMYDPPLQLEPIVAELKHPQGGVALLAASGAVYAFGCPWDGGANGKPYFAGRQAARLELNPQAGNGRPWYIIRATSGEAYGYTGF